MSMARFDASDIEGAGDDRSEEKLKVELEPR
jgi:hypothetical protein